MTTPSVWFLTLNQGLYGPKTLTQVAEQSQSLTARLNQAYRAGALPVNVMWKPVLTDFRGVVETIRAADSDLSCVGLIAWMHSFSAPNRWMAGLNALKTPLLHLYTQASFALPWSESDADLTIVNEVGHGDRELGHTGTRHDVPCVTVSGHVSDRRTQEQIAAWQRSALGVSAVRNVRLARFRDNLRVGDRVHTVDEGDNVETELPLGASVSTYSVDDLVERVDAVTSMQVDALLDEYPQAYDIAPELRPGGARHDSLRHGAQIEAGLRALLTEGGFRAFTTDFQDLDGLRQRPALAVQRLMADGYGFAVDGDWKTAVMLHTVKAMGARAQGGTSFIKDSTYRLGPGTSTVLSARMLEICPSLAAAKPRIEIRPRRTAGGGDPVRLVFDAAPAPARILGMCDLGDRFRLVLNEADVIDPGEPLPEEPVARAVWKPKPDLATSAGSWAAASGPHHTVLSTAVDTEQLADFAHLLGVELVVIDATTKPRDFADRLRWNQAYYGHVRGS
jgi:L-arabinose isomerase